MGLRVFLKRCRVCTNEPETLQKNRRLQSVNNRHWGGFFLVQKQFSHNLTHLQEVRWPTSFTPYLVQTASGCIDFIPSAQRDSHHHTRPVDGTFKSRLQTPALQSWSRKQQRRKLPCARPSSAMATSPAYDTLIVPAGFSFSNLAGNQPNFFVHLTELGFGQGAHFFGTSLENC